MVRTIRAIAFLSINSGAGGTEACDWAGMLMRMYQRWAESRGWEVEVQDALPGEGAGIKSVTMIIKGENAYGFCKAERACIGSCAFHHSIQTSGGTRVLPAWIRSRSWKKRRPKS